MKKMVVLLTVLLALLLTLSACSESTQTADPTPTPAVASSPNPESSPAPAPIPTPDPAENPDPVPAENAHDMLVGWWSYVRGTASVARDGAQRPADFVYLDWLHPWAEISETGSAMFLFYGSVFGNLLPLSPYEFLLTDLILRSEGSVEHLDEDRWVSYDPSTGLLRYTFFNSHAEEYIHSYFERADGPPF